MNYILQKKKAHLKSLHTPICLFQERSNETSSEREPLIGPPKLTRFEKARIVGARALQIALGAPILIQPAKERSSPIDISIEELNQGVLPITIRRTLPDGVTYQDIPIKWLL